MTRELQQNYRSLADERIREIALFEVRELRTEAVAVLRDEIRRRNLPPELEEGIDVQLRGLDPMLFQELVAWFRNSPCPRCGRSEAPLNVFRFGERPPLDSTLSINPALMAGCPDCLRREVARATRRTTRGCLLAPWAWFGLGPTLRNLDDIERAETLLRSNEPGPELAEFVHDRLGALYVARKQARGRSGA